LKKKKNTCIDGSAFRVEEKNLLTQLNSKGPFLILHWTLKPRDCPVRVGLSLRTRTRPSGKANQDTEAGNHRQKKTFGRNEIFQQEKRAPQTQELEEKSCASDE
jgi:hypothetical protein